MWCLTNWSHDFQVIPAGPGVHPRFREEGRAGIQDFEEPLDSRVRGNDDRAAANGSSNGRARIQRIQWPYGNETELKQITVI